MSERPPSPTPEPPRDDEAEHPHASLKAGAGPGSAGPPPDAPEARAPGADASDAGDAASFAGARAEGPPALVGEVIDDTRPSWSPRGGRASGAPGASGAGMPPGGPGVRVVRWGIGQAEAGRLGLWIGVTLVAFGAYLVLADRVAWVATLGSLGMVILGVVLVAWHLADRAGAWAVHLGMVLAGFGLLRLVAELAGLPSTGWGPLGAGLGLLLIAVIRVTRGEGVRWQAWLGGILAVFGAWGVLGSTIPGFPTFGDVVVPLALVLVGVLVLRRGFRQS